jgi:hypothetical protein
MPPTTSTPGSLHRVIPIALFCLTLTGVEETTASTPTATPTPTPEPGAILQLVTGAIGLSFLNRRRLNVKR